MLHIDGLTPRQVKICDQLWECNTPEDTSNFIKNLHPSLHNMAATLMQLIIHEALEEQIESMDCYPDAENMLKRLKKDYL
jgi:predicted DNA-binding protein